MSEYMGVIFMEEKISSGRLHRLVLSDRHTGSVTGVNDVVSFDENEIVLEMCIRDRCLRLLMKHCRAPILSWASIMSRRSECPFLWTIR